MSFKKKILLASFWVFFAYGLSQIIRLGSSLITTRYLAPEVFGLVSIVYAVIFGIEMFADVGFYSYIVRHKTPEDPHLLNAIWTLQVIRGWIVFLVIAAVALVIFILNNYFPHFISGVYAEHELPLLILSAGIGSLISGHKSLAPIIMSYRMDRGKQEIIDLCLQVFNVIFMLVWLVISPSIWAIIIPVVTASFISLILGYKLFPFRHKFVYDKLIFADVYEFAKWIVLSSALTYIFLQGDKLYFGGVLDAKTLGLYSIALTLSGAITSVTDSFIGKVAFPVFAKVANESRSELSKKYYQFKSRYELIAYTGIGLLFYLSPILISTIYDVRYHEAGYMLQILMISVTGSLLSGIGLECLCAISTTKVRSVVMAIRTAGLLIMLPIAFNYYGFYAAIWVVTLNSWLGIPAIYYALKQNNILILKNELRTAPMLLVGYLLGYIIKHIFF